MIRSSIERDGALLRITLASPRANILDEPTLLQLTEAVLGAREERELRGILIDHDGTDFSFGASVEEHLPDKVERMIEVFGAAIRAVVHASVPVIAAVDGRCLGGALELVAAAQVRVVHEGALLGQPEIQLGVFPPAAVALAPFRAHVLTRLSISGEVVSAKDLAHSPLIDVLCTEPASEVAMGWFDRNLVPRSAFSLRQVTRACDPGDAFDEALYHAERRYLDELMAGSDPAEGLTAFLEKRKPSWKHL